MVMTAKHRGEAEQYKPDNSQADKDDHDASLLSETDVES
jgi:hypothetical protein